VNVIDLDSHYEFVRVIWTRGTRLHAGEKIGYPFDEKSENGK
jgi:hypothetical protein